MVQALLQRAAQLIQTGSLAEGATLCRQLLEATPGHPDALHLLAMATQDSDPATAETMFRESLARVPRQPAVLVNFGNFLRGTGRVAEAEILLRRAVEMAPDFVPAWYNLGVVLHDGGKEDEATRCASRTTALAPRYGAGWELLAAIEQKRGNLAQAIAACREGLRHVPDAAKLHYSLGQLLREDCSFPEAVRAYGSALACGFETPELYRNHGEANFESGDSARALAVLTAGATRYPQSALLHRLLARLRWETGAPGDPLTLLRQAVSANIRADELLAAFIELLLRLGRLDEARTALAEGRRGGCPQTPDLLLHEALCHARIGDANAATRQFMQVIGAYPAHAKAKLAFAEYLLSTGDPARAEALCDEVLGANPLDQLAWAYRGTAWRLLGDSRETWLLDYERMVIPVQVPEPAGYASGEVFFRDVRDVLETLHRTHTHPIDQTLRGGTQTNGYLFRFKHPLLRLLEAQIRVAVRSALGGFPHEAGHPYWGRRLAHSNDDAFRFAGAWSVRLKSQGFHVNHIHPEGWISSALYIALPDEVSVGDGLAGHIQFGVPPIETGLALAPRRDVKPQVGLLLLFPSYMWHGTVPFAAEQSRITVAFDLLPQD